jgi:hypothetical protein
MEYLKLWSACFSQEPSKIIVPVPLPIPKVFHPYALPDPPKPLDLVKRFFDRGVCWGQLFFEGSQLWVNQEQWKIHVITLFTTPIRTARCISILKTLKVEFIVHIMSPPDSQVYEQYAVSGGKLSRGELGLSLIHI